MLGYNIVTGTEAGKSCKLFERQPPLHGTQKEQGQRLCRVCPYALEEGHDRKPLGVTLKEPLEGNNKEPLDLFHPQPRRRLILSTSLRATFGGAKGTNGRTEQQYGAGAVERECLLQLREGDSPVSIARDFVANRLGFEVRHEGIERPIVAEPLGSDLMAADDGQQAPLEGKSCTFEGTSEGGQGQKRCSLQGGGGGARLVEWVTQTLEAEIAERKVTKARRGAYLTLNQFIAGLSSEHVLSLIEAFSHNRLSTHAQSSTTIKKGCLPNTALNTVQMAENLIRRNAVFASVYG